MIPSFQPCPAINIAVWHEPAPCEHPAGHGGYHSAEVECDEEPLERRRVAWDDKGIGRGNDIINVAYSPMVFVTDEDAGAMRADGMSETAINNEERALRYSYIPNPEYKTRHYVSPARAKKAARATRAKGAPVTDTIAAQNVHTARKVPLHELALEVKGWTNPREFTGLTGEILEDLGGTIKERGIIDPPKVKQIIIAPNRIVNLVIDGQRRVLSGREVLPKDYEVPVVDVDGKGPEELTPELADRLLMVALTTYKREGLSSFELSNVASKLKDRGKTLEYISKVVDRDPSWVSKMLTARKNATPKLMLQWRKGEITDEQFKELATLKDATKQEEAVKDVVETRKTGDKAEARVKAKEIVERAKAASKPAPVKPTKPTEIKPVVKGPQIDIFGQPVAAAPAEKAAEKPKMRNRAVLDDFLHMFDKRPPTSDYVKGMADAIRYVCGTMEADDFSKAWHQYANRVEGKTTPKKSKPAKASKPAKPAKAKKPAKAAKKKSKGKK